MLWSWHQRAQERWRYLRSWKIKIQGSTGSSSGLLAMALVPNLDRILLRKKCLLKMIGLFFLLNPPHQRPKKFNRAQLKGTLNKLVAATTVPYLLATLCASSRYYRKSQTKRSFETYKQCGWFFQSINFCDLQGPSPACASKTKSSGMTQAAKDAVLAKHNELRRK